MDHWRWKFVENVLGESPIILGFDEEKGLPVGQYAVCPLFINVGEKVILGAQSLDTMVRDGYRKRGLMIRLAEECYRAAEKMGVHVVYGYPNERSYHGLVDRLGFDDVGTIPLYTKALRGGEWGSSSIDGEWVVETVEAVDGSFDLLWDHVRGGTGVGVTRDCHYLDWRYRRFPDYPYHQLAIRHRGEMVGYVVMAIRSRRGIVADFLALKPEHAVFLVRHIERYLGKRGCQEILFYIGSRRGEGDILLEEGYRKGDSRLVLTVKVLGSDTALPQLMDIDKWYVTYGDCDGI